MSNQNECDGDCENCQCNINPIQDEFRERLSSLLTDVLNKITPKTEDLDEINIAADLLSQAAVIYAQCGAPMSDAIFHLDRYYEEIEEQIISEGISEQKIVEVNPTDNSTNHMN